MIYRSPQAGFTAIELLITLFVAAAFLIAGYQLFNVVVKDGGQARAESRAANVAYDYMRRYSPSATNPCTPQTLLTNSNITIDSLSNAKITVAITCPDFSTTSLSKIDVTMTFNTPQQTVKYSTYTTGSSSQISDVTEGLLAWWKFNGDANSAVGTMNGTVTNATVVAGQNGQENGAYSFNGTNAKIVFPLTGLPATQNTVSVSIWIKQATALAPAVFSASPVDSANGFAIYTPSTNNLVYWYNGNTSTGVLTASHQAGWFNVWNFWTFTSAPGEGMKMYRNGIQIASNSNNGTFTKGTKNLDLGIYNGSTYWTGSVDDFRIYDRVLSNAEILTLYNGGAK